MGHCNLILIFASCLNSVLLVKSQQGEYDITDKGHTYMPFELWCWRRCLRVPWTARRSKSSILKKISSEYSLGGLCWSWSSNYLPTWWEEMIHWKRPLCRKHWRQEEKGKTGWDGLMASPSRWTWGWVRFRSRWCLGKPGMLQSMALHRDGHNWKDWTELNWTNWEERDW